MTLDAEGNSSVTLDFTSGDQSDVSQDVASNLTEPPGDAPLAFQPMVAAYVVPVLFGIIFVVGVVGNGTLIFAVIRNKKMRNVPNIYILSLAIGDLLLILTSVPISATLYSFTIWPFGEPFCQFNHFMQTLSLGVSVFTLTALSGDRYTVIVNPMSKHTGNPTFRTFAVAIGIWVISAILAIPDLLSSEVYRHQEKNNTRAPFIPICDLYRKDWPIWYPKFHVMFRFCVYFAIPVVIIGFFYVMMAHMLLLSGNTIPGDGDMKQHKQRQIEAREKVAKVVLSFVVIFVICWFPRHIYLIWYHYDPSGFNTFWHVFKITAYCFCFINSCVNPMALYFLSRQFRRLYNNYLFCLCIQDQYSRMDQSTMHKFSSTVRRTSTSMTIVQSQSMC
ncbi:neuropeptide CCHamide-1 receptor-like [Liolophura sinensis]|uniref:neuropeptide CCHamide-1 receptor-like n=1 Tax=Liolophura sinensis TaxID=3198878 RepID=UPI003159089F